jgi:hypothetical protein
LKRVKSYHRRPPQVVSLTDVGGQGHQRAGEADERRAISVLRTPHGPATYSGRRRFQGCQSIDVGAGARRIHHRARLEAGASPVDRH